MNYKQALKQLEIVSSKKGDTADPEKTAEAVLKAQQALRDCLEMGLNGEGD